MKNKNILALMSVAAVCAVFFLVKTTYSYFIDKETATNIIQIGKISAKLDENFQTPDNVLAGREFTKAPKLTNDGTKDEFVFIGVTVPRENITLLYEEDTEVGGVTKKTGEIRKTKGSYEIFRIKTNDAGTKIPDDCFNDDTHTYDYDVDFSYNAGTFKLDSTPDKEGWIFIKHDTKTTDGNAEDIYVFAYNKRLLPNDSTITLFDKAQLKSFINGEVKSEKNIEIQPYAIQADGLKVSGLTENFLGSVTLSDLNIIFGVIEEEAGKP